jgi:hypothetical protein
MTELPGCRRRTTGEHELTPFLPGSPRRPRRQRRVSPVLQARFRRPPEGGNSRAAQPGIPLRPKGAEEKHCPHAERRTRTGVRRFRKAHCSRRHPARQCTVSSPATESAPKPTGPQSVGVGDGPPPRSRDCPSTQEPPAGPLYLSAAGRLFILGTLDRTQGRKAT